MLENNENRMAFNKFVEMVKNEGGDISYLGDTTKFKKAKYISAVETKKIGIVQEINAEEIGKLACYLGAGRINKEDEIEPDVGIILNKKVGDKVIDKEILAYIYANDREKTIEAEKKILEIYKIK